MPTTPNNLRKDTIVSDTFDIGLQIESTVTTVPHNDRLSTLVVQSDIPCLPHVGRSVVELLYSPNYMHGELHCNYPAKFTAADARRFVDEDGYLTVTVALPTDILEELGIYDPSNDTDIYDVLHRTAFSEGVPHSCEIVVRGVISGHFIIEYTTSVEGFSEM